MSKRIIALVLAFILVFSCAAFADDESVSENTEEIVIDTLETESETETEIETESVSTEYLDKDKYVKLGLYYGSSNYASTIVMESEYGFNVYEESTGYLVKTISETTLSFDLSDQEISGYIYMSAATDPDARIITMQTDRDKSAKKYRDGMYFIYNNGFRVINYIEIEHYVWGVVNREMSSSNPLEALKAQAVAARTYALYIKDKGSGHQAMGFDLCATTHCQVYGGVSSESEKTTQACKETEGLVMTYNGKEIYAVFSANCGGGYTQSIYDAWGIDLDVHPYLQSVKDPYTPEHNWETTYLFTTMRQRIISYYGIDLGEITKVEISDTTSYGAVTGIKLTGTLGEKRVPRSQIMAVFNLKSTFFCIGNDGYNEITKDGETASTQYVMTANGLTEVSSEDLYIYDGSSVSKMQVSTGTGEYTMTNDVCTDGYVYMRGIGYGHGIGMSQNGAIVMARDYAKTYDEILNFYYTGITIEHY